MTSTIKGLKLEVTIGVKADVGEIRETNFRQRPEYRKENNDNFGKDIKIDASASLTMGFDSYEGEINLKELGELLKTSLHDTIHEQVKEQLDEQLNKKEVKAE